MLFIEEKLTNLKNVSNIGIIFERGDKELDFSILKKSKELLEDSRVKGLLIKGKNFSKDIIENFPLINFWQEDFFDSNKIPNNLIYPNIIKQESELTYAKSIGYTNFIIDGILLNNIDRLKKYKKNNEIFWAIPNDARNGHFWIRPEGLAQYEDIINNWILIPVEDSSNLIRRYKDKITGVLETPIILGLQYAPRTVHCLPKEFDMLRANCKGRCLSCVKCDRLLKTFNFLKEKGEDYEKE